MGALLRQANSCILLLSYIISGLDKIKNNFYLTEKLTIFSTIFAPKAELAAALSQTLPTRCNPLGELTALTLTPSWLSGAREGREGQGGEERER